MNRWLALALVLLSLAGGPFACFSPTDPLGREDALKDAQKRYTDLVRWGEIEKAGAYVDPDQRDAFLALAKQYEALRITDTETGDITFGEDDANVTVTYKGYLMSTLVEHTAYEDQQWYREEGLKNTWYVRPQLEKVLASLRGDAAETAGF